jgi:hypothetical protein
MRTRIFASYHLEAASNSEVIQVDGLSPTRTCGMSLPRGAPIFI